MNTKRVNRFLEIFIRNLILSYIFILFKLSFYIQHPYTIKFCKEARYNGIYNFLVTFYKGASQLFIALSSLTSDFLFWDAKYMFHKPLYLCILFISRMKKNWLVKLSLHTYYFYIPCKQYDLKNNILQNSPIQMLTKY